MKATLTYHSIDTSGSPISVPPAAFDEHLRWLTSGNVKVLPLTELPSHRDEDGDAVAITFDDAFLNVQVPVERLLAAGLPVTLFVVSGHVGKTNEWNGRSQRGIPTLPLLAWNGLEALAKRGAEFGTHTRTHRPLTRVSETELDDELQGSVADLQERLGIRTQHVAYPYGEFNRSVLERAALAFRWGHTTTFRMIRESDPLLRLPRLDMYYFRKQAALDGWGTPSFRRRIALIRTRRRIRGQ